jgi:hypothetical protein
MPALQEGSEIHIDCQVVDGQPLTDYVGDVKMTWPVWDRLTTGIWIPDLYTQLPKDWLPASEEPPAGTC